MRLVRGVAFLTASLLLLAAPSAIRAQGNEKSDDRKTPDYFVGKPRWIIICSALAAGGGMAAYALTNQPGGRRSGTFPLTKSDTLARHGLTLQIPKVSLHGARLSLR
jgi:hypothetical protein